MHHFSSTFVSSFRSSQTPGRWQGGPDSWLTGRQFLEQFDHHLEKFGHQVYSFDPRLPTLADDPRPALLAIQSYLRHEESPLARRRRMHEERETALARLEEHLWSWQFRRFHDLMIDTQEAARKREDAIFELGRAWGPMRASLLDLGRRLVDANVLDSADQVFWLPWDDIRARWPTTWIPAAVHPL